MNQDIHEAYRRILRSELIAAMGCTEPIAIAYAAAMARQVLGKKPEHCVADCSGNIVKNVMGVTVPNSGGLKGIDVAAILGILGGDADRGLEVLEGVTQDQIEETKQLLEKDFCECRLVPNVENLYICMHVSAGAENALVEIRNFHKNVTRIEKNGEVLFENDPVCREVSEEEAGPENPDKALLNISDILDFALSPEDTEMRALLEHQLSCNRAIAQEGLEHPYGAQVGRTLLPKEALSPANVRYFAKAWAAAGSDARMNGCAMPVVINSGSGNQGITVSLPVELYAKAYGISHERMLQALAISNLIAIHQKKYVGSLSAYCGAVSAACGAGAGISYLLGKDRSREALYEEICGTIINTIVTVGGMVCDGAKSSCAAKIACAVDCAVTAWELARQGHVFHSGEGLVMKDAERTIEMVGRMAREGMRATDTEILKIMLGR
ncbi:MAG: serine dehydratase subunit alpha family protein [Lachnospiraceae bacterium]|nr:serine dehydratase subunit alpha family protein [Lachnospiraceae bacterium]